MEGKKQGSTFRFKGERRSGSAKGLLTLIRREKGLWGADLQKRMTKRGGGTETQSYQLSM